MSTSRLEIDLAAIDRNLGVVRRVVTPSGETPRRPAPQPSPASPASNGMADAPDEQTGPARKAGPPGAHPGGHPGICAVLKQDGYGLGAVRIAKRLCATGVDMLSVYTLDEARVLADAIPQTPILVLMPVHGVERMDPLYRHAAIGRLHLTLHDSDQFTAITECAARIGAPIPVHVQVDTGMSRGGVLPDEAQVLVDKVLSSARVRLAGLMTHFSAPCCDEKFTREQARSFRDVVEAVKPEIRAFFAGQPKSAPPVDIALHAANSCAAFRSRSLHGSMVRVGQALLGFALEDANHPEAFEFAEEAQLLEPAVRWTSAIAHLEEIPAGWPVGYGAVWRAPHRADGRRTRIALIPVGYADGYARSLTGVGAVVGLTGRAWTRRGSGEGEDAAGVVDRPALPTVYAPVVGRVSMDQITVDVTDVPEAYLRPPQSPADGAAGPEVELWGRSRTAPNAPHALARRAGTITHELLTRVSPRVERAYRYPAKQAAGGAERPARAVTVGGGGGAGVGLAAR